MERKTYRIPVDLEGTFRAFLDAQDVTVTPDHIIADDRQYDPWDEHFRWHRGLWLALMDVTRAHGIWRYRVSATCDDLEWLEVTSTHPSAGRITSEMAAEAIRRADWQAMLRDRIRHR